MAEGRITNAELMRRLDRIEAGIGEVKTEFVKVQNDHENRLRKVERATWVAVGLALAGGVTGAGSLLSMLGG